MAYYDRTERAYFDPERVQLFTLKTSVKKYWYVRIKRREGTGYFQTSLKTESLDIAMDAARSLWIKMQQAEEQGLAFQDARFSATFRSFLTKQVFSPSRRSRIESVFNRYFSEYFKDKPVSYIDGAMWADYLVWRTNYWSQPETLKRVQEEQARQGRRAVFNYVETPSSATLKGERQILKQFLLWCEGRNIIKRAPRLPWNFKGIADVRFNDQRLRGKALTDTMAKKIHKRLKKWCLEDNMQENLKARKFGRFRLYYFLHICQYALIRPTTEATSLLWDDVEWTRSQRFPDLRIAAIDIKAQYSKTGEARTAILPYRQYTLLTEWRDISRSFGVGENYHHIFPKIQYPQGKFPELSEGADSAVMGRMFKKKLDEWNLRLDEEGKKITMYRYVRHTGITRRIAHSKWDIGAVATAAGVSAFELSRTYYKEFAKQNPDRFANTSPKGGRPRLDAEEKRDMKSAVALFERSWDETAEKDLYQRWIDSLVDRDEDPKDDFEL